MSNRIIMKRAILVSISIFAFLISFSQKPDKIAYKQLKDFEDMLQAYRFYRVHNSHLINLNYIKKYIRGEGGQVILQNGDSIDVSRRKRDEFLKLIGG